MAIGQKNAAWLDDPLGFDFAIAESCGVWNECGDYHAVYGDHVLQIEYPDELAEVGLSFIGVCAIDERAPLTILRDRGLVSAGTDGYVYARCPAT